MAENTPIFALLRCDHGGYVSHPWNDDLTVPVHQWTNRCEGGREIKLKQVGPRMDDGWVIDYVDDAEKTWKMVETDET